MQKNQLENLLVGAIFLLIIVGVAINTKEKFSVDRSKLPEKVEDSEYFQRWITNIKNNDLTMINADDFELIEENEIYNTKWMKVYSFDEPGKTEEFDKILANHKKLEETEKIRFSPSDRLFIDYRNIKRDGYKLNEVRLYGAKEDKIIDARILDCEISANCYFDRAYFLSNDLFVISEFSRNINKRDVEVGDCLINSECSYSIKIHLIDLINNSRLVYESKPFNIILSELIPEL